MIKHAITLAVLAAATPSFAVPVTYVANFTGPALDSELTADVVLFDPSAFPVIELNGGALVLGDISGLPSEANVHTNFSISGDFKASLTADLSNLGTRGFSFGVYEYSGGPLPISTTATPGGNIFNSGLINTQSYISTPSGFPAYNVGDGSATQVIYDLVYSGGWLQVFLNGQLFNAAPYDGGTNSRFLISLCGSSCYSTTNDDEVNIARITDFRISYDNGLTSAVPEPSAWALLILGFGCIGSAIRRRKVIERHAIA